MCEALPACHVLQNLTSACPNRRFRSRRTSVVQLLGDDTGVTWATSLQYTGFSYADWQFDGPDLIAVIRTA